MKKKNQTKKQEQKYTSIQITVGFRKELEKVRDENHFDSYENTIKYLMKKGVKK